MRNFDFLIASDSDHEKVFVEIYYQQKYIALISQENGVDNLIIEFPGLNLNEAVISRSLPLNDFSILINDAVDLLTNSQSKK